jgi:hypothetical protein
MGKGSAPVIGYWYGMTIHMGECLSADHLLEIRAADRTMWAGSLAGSGTIAINQPHLFGGEMQEGGVVGTFTVLSGDASQMPSSALSGIEHGTTRSAYRGLNTTAFTGDLGAMNKYIKPWSKKWDRFITGWSTAVWHPELAQIDQGMNPAHIIYQIMTDPNCGGRDPSSTFDDARMVAAAQTLHDEGMGLCLKWTSSESIGKFTQIVCDHIGAMWVESPSAAPGVGSSYLKLIRADYDPASLPVLDESNIIKMISYNQTLLSDTVNEVSVTYRDPSTNKNVAVTAQNLANVQAQGRVIPQSTSYPGLWNHDQAARAALRDGTVTSSLLARFKVKVKSGGPNGLGNVRKGDVLSFSYARKKVGHMPVRVLEVGKGTVSDKSITLTCAQDVFGLPSTTYIVKQPAEWIAPNLNPLPVPQQVLEEASYRDLAGYMLPADLARVASTSGYLTTLASRPGSVAYNYDITARLGTTGVFLKVGVGAFAPTGVITSDIGPTDTAIIITDASALNQVSLGSEAMLGTERIRIDALDATTGAATIARGCVDTVPAVIHPAGTQIWFTDRFTGYGKTEYLASEVIQVLLLTNTGTGRLDPSLATISSVTMDSRQVRPYPPGAVKISGVAYPATVSASFNVTWAHRNRITQADQLVDTTIASIMPANNIRYALRFLDASNAVLIEKIDIGPPTASVVLNYTGSVTMEIFTIDDVSKSWQTHRWTFTYTKPSGAVVNAITATTYTPVYDGIIVDGGA